MQDPRVQILETSRQILVSVNRFDRHKNIALAVHAFAHLREASLIDKDQFSRLRLIIAGGYDSLKAENVACHKELEDIASRIYGLKTFTIPPESLRPPPEDAQVVFLCSFCNVQRTFIFSRALCLLYTPAYEHFGIVPIEAMYSGLPVIAVNNGGPTETVKHRETGLLCEQTKEAWAEGMRMFITGELDAAKMGQAGRAHVMNTFSMTGFVDKLEGMMVQLAEGPASRRMRWVKGFLALAGVCLFAAYSLGRTVWSSKLSSDRA
jgi:alpha-1,3/alpha-1,6-mannosyltransferase